MRVSLLSFQGMRQHFVSDKIYNISIYQDAIEMIDATCKLQKPKYVLPLNLKTVIQMKGQVKKGSRQLTGFIFQYKNGHKLMVSNSYDLNNFMEIVSNQITFLEITMFYQPVEIIGRGSSSSVSILIDKFLEKQYAVKSIDKQYLKSNDEQMVLFDNEVFILQRLVDYNKENHFVHLYRVFESPTSYYLVLNLMRGKSLTDYFHKIRKKTSNKYLSKEQIRKTLWRLLNGLVILHSLNIIHRDLKPDNLLLAEPNDLDSLVIADFGLATFQHVQKYIYPFCGTQGFMAPEVFNFKEGHEKYTEKCDIYSCGIIYYWLLTGEINLNLSNHQLNQYDSATIDLLQSMIYVDPKHRISALQALDHPYFTTNNDDMSRKTYLTSKCGNENAELWQMKEHDPLNVYIMPDIKKPQLTQHQFFVNKQ